MDIFFSILACLRRRENTFNSSAITVYFEFVDKVTNIYLMSTTISSIYIPTS